MEHEFDTLPPGSKCERISLFVGIDLSYTDIAAESFSMQHEAMAHIMQINYCKAGQIVWKMENGNSIFLNPGDFSLHTLNICTDSAFRFPTGQYQGLTICIDFQKASVYPPELIAEAGIFPGLLQKKFCQDGVAAYLMGNNHTESIFSAFYDQPEKLRLPYQQVKVLELLLYLARMEFTPQNRLIEYPNEQIKIVQEIHNQFLQHMGRRITIEELSKQYLINSTTLKAAFKAVYGTSLAAHIKKHRMEQAARMLRETNKSIPEAAPTRIASAVSIFSSSWSTFFVCFSKSMVDIPPTRCYFINSTPVSEYIMLISKLQHLFGGTVMKYSTRLSDAVHLLLFVQLNPGQPLSSDAIAKSVRTNPSYIRQMMAKLKAAGLLNSNRGQAKPSLSREPGEISLLDVYRAVEGEKPLLHLDTHTNPDCGVGVHIQYALQTHFDRVQKETEASMRQITLQDVLDTYYQEVSHGG